MGEYNWDSFWKSQFKRKSAKDKLLFHGRKYFTAKYVKQIKQIMDITNKNCIEVGAGLGGCSALLKKYGANTMVLDKSNELTRHWEKASLDYTIADAKQMPFVDNSFDLVWNAGVLEHFADPVPYLSEMKRICKPEGIVCAFVPYIFDWTAHFELYGKEEVYNKKTIKDLFKSCGFRDIKTKIMWSLGGMSICSWARKE